MRDTAVRKATNSDDDELQFQNEPSEEDVSDFTSSDIDEEVSDSDDIDEAEMEGRQMNNNWRARHGGSRELFDVRKHGKSFWQRSSGGLIEAKIPARKDRKYYTDATE